MSTIPPNAYIIIIGAMRAGTTTLYSLLAGHPQICPCKYMKEPMFFTENSRHRTPVINYADLWDFDEQQHQFVIEASTPYTKYPYEGDVPGRIRESGICPNLIYVVRNPFERIESQYHFSRKMPWFDLDRPLYHERYVCMSRYFTQLQQYRRFFPKNRLTIVDFDALSNDQSKVMRGLFKDLGLSAYKPGGEKKTHYNQSDFYSPGSRQLIGRWIQKIKKVPPFLTISDRISTQFKSNLLLMGEKMLVAFSVTPPPSKRVISQAERTIIYEKLVDDMERFQNEYGFDISKWGFK